MTERPILFSGPMVKAILAGKKTQTRRVAKLLLPGDKQYIHAASHDEWVEKRVTQCPYGLAGARLWVRETWQWFGRRRNGDGPEGGFQYRADMTQRTFQEFSDPNARWSDFVDADKTGKLNRWRPSIFMPRWASRITLEITDVRVERIQEIRAQDIFAEGAVERSHDDPHLGKCPVSSLDGRVYVDLKSLWATGWDKLNAKRGYGWNKNPWVWVIEFKRVNPETGPGSSS